ncbi:beta-ketoacyl-[acyl-carrier-protein] synthase family protein [Corallococcus silvisoli]|uniref:beta-ketoacyl-[acyl-carrier-protein] synthase family protein n=1 Tax=Corallococcus silvisoli TaxID=2697031 RepID=UPI0013789365|nr:beta-ketoacyl-[acyl-carrier-protein] synthase family protein [Corallococcus silvisoli]NBD09922.1 beta-ketoacyl-[acyl-carrier-protein] synthase family protein [Corallococcus silvisoli]
MTAHRVVITGMGVTAANALSTGALARALEERRSGIRETAAFGTEGRARTAGEVDLPGPPLDAEDRVSRLALHAAEQALQDSGLAPGGRWSEDTGVMIGTSRGPALSLERFMRSGDAEARRKLFAEVPFSSIARNIATRFGLGGVLSTVTMACVSSSLAIGRAVDEIRRGRASLMVAGGADALTQLSFSGFSVLRAMTPTVCRPFDHRRNGMVLGEGAGILVLEALEHARQRGAKIHAELCGWGTAGDAHHPTSPHPEGRGLQQAMASALAQSGLTTEEIDFVNLHGTGTPANDPAECHALRQVFGARTASLPVNSLKPYFGHTLGASGALELIGSLLGMERDFIPPTLHCEELDAKCDVDVVRGEGRKRHIDVLMSTKSAFGGANVALIARRLPEAGREGR